jgi:hypothetical protein
MHKTIHEEYKDGSFDVKVWYSPEFVPLADLYDETVSDIKEMEQKVDTGNASWFIAGVDYFYKGHEVGSDTLGGNYYEEWEEDALNEGLSGYLEDMKANAKDQAFKNIKELKADLEKDFALA